MVRNRGRLGLDDDLDCAVKGGSSSGSNRRRRLLVASSTRRDEQRLVQLPADAGRGTAPRRARILLADAGPGAAGARRAERRKHVACPSSDLRRSRRGSRASRSGTKPRTRSGRNVRLDHPGDHVDRRTPRREHEGCRPRATWASRITASSTSWWRDHHQIGEPSIDEQHGSGASPLARSARFASPRLGARRMDSFS